MSSVFDVANLEIIETEDAAEYLIGSPVDVVEILTPIINTTLEVIASYQIVTEVAVPGLQGPPGVQNVYVGPTPPLNPEPGWIWIDTS